jgi:hypothetical protein
VKRLSGGISKEEAYVHAETGARMFRHVIVKNGEEVYQQIRTFSKVFR